MPSYQYFCGSYSSCHRILVQLISNRQQHSVISIPTQVWQLKTERWKRSFWDICRKRNFFQVAQWRGFPWWKEVFLFVMFPNYMYRLRLIGWWNALKNYLIILYLQPTNCKAFFIPQKRLLNEYCSLKPSSKMYFLNL